MFNTQQCYSLSFIAGCSYKERTASKPICCSVVVVVVAAAAAAAAAVAAAVVVAPKSLTNSSL